MVNEINKPTDPLSERLAASNRQLYEVQEEHRQLLQEMEGLRARVTALSRVNVSERQTRHQRCYVDYNDEIPSETSSATTTSTNLGTASSSESEVLSTESVSQHNIESVEATSSNVASVESDVAADNTAKVAENLEQLKVAIEAEAKDDTESTEYLQQKIAEIAALKAQYKRVEHMINTTNLIEDHLKSKTTVLDAVQAKKIDEATTSKVEATTSSSSSSSSSVSKSQTTGTTGQPEAAKEELLSAMLNMFTDFSDDLRGQAESLRAERERIRALKEELMMRRKKSS